MKTSKLPSRFVEMAQIKAVKDKERFYVSPTLVIFKRSVETSLQLEWETPDYRGTVEGTAGGCSYCAIMVARSAFLQDLGESQESPFLLEAQVTLPSQSSKCRSEGEPVLFTLHQELPHRGASKTAALATQVALATHAAPPNLGQKGNQSHLLCSKSCRAEVPAKPLLRPQESRWRPVLLLQTSVRRGTSPVYSAPRAAMLRCWQNRCTTEVLAKLLRPSQESRW
ncbi:hypothetical protein P7K49_006601 [Saguinus oedipus]|uniref:Uncharacterized protein n=1 Tax=Saguinus oedipus TaxID=9490 RepID=A0ABQ9W3C7_SAGOE|nr:hypothetical protein P7K49_006601 [Saguinus oedipus]